MRTYRSWRRGNQAIEFALVMPVLLAVVAATIDWGFFWHAKFHLVNSLHVGARSAAFGDACVPFPVHNHFAHPSSFVSTS